MITENGKELGEQDKLTSHYEQGIHHGDCFTREDQNYIVMSNDNPHTKTTYILVTSYGNQLCRHYNPLSSSDLFNKLMSDNYVWEYVGQYIFDIIIKEKDTIYEQRESE